MMLAQPKANPFDAVITELSQAVSEAKTILVLIRTNPTFDQVASALGLYLSLQHAAKQVTVASATPMRVEFNRLVAVNKIVQTIGNRNLVVSFPYVKDSIEKVSYNVDADTFNLIIQPKTGFPSLKSDKVHYSYSGAEADLVISVGVQKLDDLGPIYINERHLLDTVTMVNIDTNFTNSKFGRYNLIWNEFSSNSEVVYEFISRLRLTLDADISTNLLAGLSHATQNFQRYGVKAKAYEIAGKLMKAGARKPPVTPPVSPSPQNPLGAPFTPPPSPLQQPSPLTAPPAPQTPLPPPASAEPPLQDKQDWLRPKIYKGSTKV